MAVLWTGGKDTKEKESTQRCVEKESQVSQTINPEIHSQGERSLQGSDPPALLYVPFVDMGHG